MAANHQMNRDASLRESIRKRLTEEKQKIQAELMAKHQPGEELAEGWQERDDAAEDEIRDVEYQHRDALLQRVRQIDRALARIETGTYGFCIRCRKKISSKRLDLNPAVALCVDCQASVEGEMNMPTL